MVGSGPGVARCALHPWLPSAAPSALVICPLDQSVLKFVADLVGRLQSLISRRLIQLQA